MVLGETGILGVIAFIIFLIVFIATCHQRHYAATLTLFAVYLSTNMAEATFFSPSGGGGVMWIIMVVGGFVIDMNRVVARQAEIAVDTAMQALPSPMPPMTEEGTDRDENAGEQLAHDESGRLP